MVLPGSVATVQLMDPLEAFIMDIYCVCVSGQQNIRAGGSTKGSGWVSFCKFFTIPTWPLSSAAATVCDA